MQKRNIQTPRYTLLFDLAGMYIRFILFADYLRKKKKITVLDVRIIAPVLFAPANQISADAIGMKIGPSPNVGALRSRHVLCHDDICTEEPPSHSPPPPPARPWQRPTCEMNDLANGDGDINCAAGLWWEEVGQAPAAEVGEDEECRPRLPTELTLDPTLPD